MLVSSRPLDQLTNLTERKADLDYDAEHRNFQSHGVHTDHRLTVPGFSGGPAALLPVPPRDFTLHPPGRFASVFIVTSPGRKRGPLWNAGCCRDPGGNDG
jgi:hypothetical protein